MSAMAISLIVFACVFGGTIFGMFLRNKLPSHHLSGDTKDVIRLGTGLIGTIAGLVLGLLIASANSTYESQSSQIRQLTANVILLDRTLAMYGPETDPLRSLLRRGVSILADRIWQVTGSILTKRSHSRRATQPCRFMMKSRNYRHGTRPNVFSRPER